MSHLHASNVKFRPPLPDICVPRPALYKEQKIGEPVDSVCRSLQADFGCETTGTHPVWLSSTTPSGWIWQSHFPGSHGVAVQLVKRHSICELEGDCCLEDIQNQTGKFYTSLSQTKSGMKMVQSLVPIWEEEYQRTGIQESFNSTDCSKPPAGEVLKDFVLGLDYARMFSDLIIEVQKHSLEAAYNMEEGSVQQYPDVGSSIAQMDDSVSLSCLNLTCTPKVTVSDVLFSDELHVMPRLEQCSTSQQAPVETTKDSPDVARNANLKIPDNEDIRLLSWLASSQAINDISSDDEIGCRVISSSLLPQVTYKEALERAHMEYENTSQKECQDILDSIEDIKDEQSEGNTCLSGDDTTSCHSDSIIPQFDGAFDDQAQISDGKASAANMSSEFERSSSSRDKEAVDSRRHSGRYKKGKILWGPLPLFTEQTEQEGDISSSPANSVESVSSEMSTCSNSSGPDNVSDLEPVTDKLEIKSKQTKGSLRDLMRRKRFSHGEISEHDKLIGATQPEDDERLQNEGSSVNFQLKCSKVATGYVEPFCTIQHEALNERTNLTTFPQLRTDESNDSRSYEHLKSCLDDNTAVYDEHLNHKLASHVAECVLDSADTIIAELPCKENISHSLSASPSRGGNLCITFSNTHEHDGGDSNQASQNVDFSVCKKQTEFIFQDAIQARTSAMEQEYPHYSVQKGLSDGDSITNAAKFFEMKFSMKPPTIEQMNSLSDVTPCGTSIEHVADAIQESSTNSCTAVPSFFEHEVEVVHRKKVVCNKEVADSLKTGLGIPNQYQNDGSTLYMLTYANLPPSSESVNHWLLKQRGNFRLQLLERKDCFSGKENEITSTFPEKELCIPHLLHEISPVCSLSSQVSQFNASDQLLLQTELGCAPKQDCDHLSEQENLKPASENIMLKHESRTSDISCSYLDSNGSGDGGNWHNVSQISGPDQKSKLTPLSQIGFRDPASTGTGQQLTLMSIEVQAECRGDLRPDPQFDAVNIVIIAVQEDSSNDNVFYVLLRGNDIKTLGRNVDGISGCNFVITSNEKKLFGYLANIVQLVDPDILMGWEIQGSSLGFLAERAACLGINLLKCISRTPLSGVEHGATPLADNEQGTNVKPETLVSNYIHLKESLIEDEWGRTHASGIHVGGRIVLNLWRLMRGEVKLNMYTMEAVAEEILRRKIPSIPSRVLNRWFLEGTSARFRCIEHLKQRVKLDFAIIDQLDLMNRTSELARVFGIDFFSVLSRGSQYRVESMMLRLAHSQNYLALSPGNQQVALQPAMECLPLVMEPMSGFYADPVVVLDFQSLYPSMIIAYNLCYSTCLGSILPSKANVLGVTSFSPDRHLLLELNNQILMCPNGVMYVPSKVCQGILPRLLEEILSTRIMVKQAMKKFGPSQQVLQRIYNARQLALKLIANVTYGYTAAGFSGRMPCAELADSIVQCGRKTLETAISYINEHAEWNARVVYGDTDSMFVLLKGRSLKEAFRIGSEIASAITAMNPNPVTLKLEKVYHPCFLLTKKRYVGYSYENPDQQTPKFDAKGIETIRRDTCQAVSKILERSLRMFFENQDLSKVKAYLKRQWARILSGKVSLQDFVFVKEVRLGTYSTDAASLPPAAIVATKAMRMDPRAEPRYAERIPFVVIHGEPGSRLVDMVVDPLDLLEISSPYRLNEIYYIRKQIIPALQRVFGLLGADLNSWFSEVPRKVRPTLSRCHYSSTTPIHEMEENKHRNTRTHAKRSRIDSYYISKHCCVCGCLVQLSSYICDDCSMKGPEVAAFITGKTSKLEKEIQHLSSICGHCGGADFIFDRGVKCTSLACSVFYERRKIQKELQVVSAVAVQLGLYPKCFAEWF